MTQLELPVEIEDAPWESRVLALSLLRSRIERAHQQLEEALIKIPKDRWDQFEYTLDDTIAWLRTEPAPFTYRMLQYEVHSPRWWECRPFCAMDSEVMRCARYCERLYFQLYALEAGEIAALELCQKGG